MAFTYDPATPAGRVRLHLADTDAGAFVFDDAEIDAFLDLAAGDVYRASALASLSVASDAARQARAVAAGNLKIDREGVADHYRAQARAFLAMAAVGEGSISRD
ncbi:MAG: hypothetical protein KC466_19080 [Myxococcales bacterium]|nr:hypothetical protein [Myxococcales bacterium]